MQPVTLSARDARRVQLAAQGLLGRRIVGGPRAVLERTRAVQLDTISVLARSHELISLARLGAVPRERIERAYWGGPPFGAFEYWYHAACILPVEEWPYLGFRRDERRERGFRWHRMEDADGTCALVMAQIRERGPLTANDLGGAKRGGPWWDWSETKIAAEWLLDVGDLVCTTRRGYQRVYDLPERAVPDALLGQHVPRDQAIAHLLEQAASALGVATIRDLAAYTGLKPVEAASVLPHASLEPAVVEGWKDKAVLGRGALGHLSLTGATATTARARPVMLSPFDSLICDRQRLSRVFGVDHRLEAYVPRHKRIHGYYSMPVLSGDRIVAKVDPKREGHSLVARSVHAEPGHATARVATAVARALNEAARWINADNVVVEASTPPELARVIVALL